MDVKQPVKTSEMTSVDSGEFIWPCQARLKWLNLPKMMPVNLFVLKKKIKVAFSRLGSSFVERCDFSG